MGRTALEYVGDVYILTLYINGVKITVEKLTGTPDKGYALKVLLLAGRLAHKHERGIAVPYAENAVGAALGKSAGGAGAAF